MTSEKICADQAAGLRCRAEERLKERRSSQRPKDGVRRPAEETRRLVQELQIHQIELEMQNEELRQTRAELETLLRQYTDLYDFAPVGYFTLGRDGTIRRVNQTGADLLREERARLVNRRFEIFVSQADRPAFDGFLMKVFTNRTSAYADKAACEVTLNKEGDLLPASETQGQGGIGGASRQVRIEAQATEDGQECLAVMMDITRRRQAEETLLVANNDLERLVAKRTATLEETNRWLLAEIEERKNSDAARRETEAALKENESSMQSILESTADGILAVNRDNKVIFANQRFTEMWMIPEELIAGEDDAVLFQHVLDQLSDLQGFLEKVRELYKSKEDSFDTLYFKDGRVFERLSRPLLQEGELQGRVWLFRDVTLRKRAEEALRKSEERYRFLFDAVPVGIGMADLEGTVYAANRSIQESTGYTLEEFKAVKIGDTYVDLNERKQLLQVLRESGQVRDYEIRLRRKDGTVYPALVNIDQIEHDGQKVILTTQRDITERKRMERELAIESQRLAETNTALNVLLQHREKDIREMEKKIVANIKTSVLPYLGDLRKRLSTPAQLNYLDVIEFNLQQIITPFLQNLTARFADFTSREIQIATLIKDGKSSKEIADIIMISVRSVEFHRNNIRKKLGLAYKANNLRSFLLTLSE